MTRLVPPLGWNHRPRSHGFFSSISMGEENYFLGFFSGFSVIFFKVCFYLAFFCIFCIFFSFFLDVLYTQKSSNKPCSFQAATDNAWRTTYNEERRPIAISYTSHEKQKKIHLIRCFSLGISFVGNFAASPSINLANRWRDPLSMLNFPLKKIVWEKSRMQKNK